MIAEAVALGVVSNAISLCLGHFVPRALGNLKEGKSKRALRKFWNGIEGEVLIVTCGHESPVPDGEETKPMYLGFGDAAALKHVLEFLSDGGPSHKRIKIREYFQGLILPEDRNNNIICIGAGCTNKLATELLYEINAPAHFFDNLLAHPCQENKTIRNKDGSIEKKPKVINGKVCSDVGLVIKAKHPEFHDKKVIIIAGAYSYGTLAAAKFATSERKLRQYESYLENDSFEVIVSTPVNGYQISERKVESMNPQLF